MAQKISDVMARDLTTVSAGDPIEVAARQMKDHDIGDVIVLKDDGSLCGIVTDRDIVVRAVAESRDLSSTSIRDICSHEVVSVSPDDDVEKAAQVMREQAVRRLPVTEDGSLVGIVSIGDLAIERDPDSALADVSAASGNA